jgi:hypothetical protein
LKIKEIKEQNFADNKQEYIKGHCKLKYDDCDQKFIESPHELINKVSKIFKEDFNQSYNLYPFIKENTDYYSNSNNLLPLESKCFVKVEFHKQIKEIHVIYEIYPLYARLIGRQEDSIADALNKQLAEELKASEKN